MQRRTHKRRTLFCVKKRADEIWEPGENPHPRQCTLLPLRLPPRRGTVPIIALALTTGGSPHVRKPPPLYIPVGSPKRPQPPGHRGVAPAPPYVPEGSQNQPQPSGHRGFAGTAALQKVLTRSTSSAPRDPPVYFERVRGRLSGTTKRHQLPIYNR
jgi:hypothetical protein